MMFIERSDLLVEYADVALPTDVPAVIESVAELIQPAVAIEFKHVPNIGEFPDVDDTPSFLPVHWMGVVPAVDAYSATICEIDAAFPTQAKLFTHWLHNQLFKFTSEADPLLFTKDGGGILVERARNAGFNVIAVFEMLVDPLSPERRVVDLHYPQSLYLPYSGDDDQSVFSDGEIQDRVFSFLANTPTFRDYGEGNETEIITI